MGGEEKEKQSNNEKMSQETTSMSHLMAVSIPADIGN
jgi:hypothetical protein